MSEPISGTAAGVAGWKIIGGVAGMGALGAGLAAVVVMCMMPARSTKEWTVGIISTVVLSLGGGAFVIEHWQLQRWAYSPFGLVTMLALVFACGLPAWAIVRWLFNYIENNRDRDLRDVVRDVKEVL